MNHLKLKRAEFDSVMHSGENLLIYFYKEKDPASTLGMERIRQLEQLVAKNFRIYIVDISEDPEICDAFDVVSAPQIVAMKNCRIYKRTEDLLYANQILDLLK